jgi:DNA-binding NtrC family response regulator
MSGPEKKIRALIIDDDSAILEVYARMIAKLCEEVHQIHVVGNVDLQGIRAFIIEHDINCVITDWDFKTSFNGESVMDMVRSLEGGDDIGMILSSGDLDNELVITCFGRMTCPLTKPVSMSAFHKAFNVVNKLE